jgi:hypothetical protein
MKILNEPIESFKFNDVVSFCEEGHREGIQIDYKRDYSSKGLAKHIVALSNSRGGVIIIGVEEDNKTGFPKSWDGIDADAKQIERLHQEIANIEPYPSCTVYATDSQENKFFILVRVFAGDNTPYYVQNDSNVYVRTGNITKSIDIASPDGLELLFGKREKAEKARNIYSLMADDTYDALVEREEEKINKKIQKQNEEKNIPMLHGNGGFIGLDDVLCKITIQPYFPDKSIANPKEIKDGIDDIRFKNSNVTFPQLNVTPSPKGIGYFSFSEYESVVEFQQILGQGLIQNRFTASRIRTDNELRVVNMWLVAIKIFGIFQFAKRFYSKYNYQGVLVGNIHMSGLKSVPIRRIVPAGQDSWDEYGEGLLSEYNWKVKIDTNILNNGIELKKYYIDLLREIYWDFGFEDISEDTVDVFLKQSGISFDE